MPARKKASHSPVTEVTAGKLETYRAKRDFARTDEPSGGSAVSTKRKTTASKGLGDGARFVVQRHRASRLHYDFRLEIDGVLVSWSVPKGPTLDPSTKRLAIRTEDHPLDYASFEGVIPRAEYGGGDVIVWDEGTFLVHQHPDSAAALADGELHLELHGHKLVGHFMLIHTKGSDGPKAQWLMFHKRDGAAVDGWDPEDFPLSVLTGRSNDDVRTDAENPRPLPVDHPELVALDELGASGTWHFGGRELKLTNLGKVLFPASVDEAVTKRDLIRYSARMAPMLLPHLVGRPVNLHRFPNGIAEAGFWNKAVPKHAAEWIGRWDNPHARSGETITYFVASEPATLAWLANYGAIELHPWTSTTEHPDQPSYALFDLDPGDATTWDELLILARLHRTALEHLGVDAFPKVTGQRGIQIWVPIERGPSFQDTTAWVETVSRTVGRIVPELVSWKWNVKDRGGLARLDYTQNAVNKTLVVPYGVRAAPGAPVSTPITWDKLDSAELRPNRWNVRNIAGRIDEFGDPFSGIRTRSQRLPALD